MKPKLILPALFFTAIFLSCSRNTEQSANESLSNPATDQQYKKLARKINPQNADSVQQATSSKRDGDGPISSKENWDRKIIKTATLNLEVKDFKKYSDAVYKTVKQYGGYIAEEEQNVTPVKSENTMVIKVPVAQFEDMMNQLPAVDAKVVERKITTDDVGGEVIDVQSRLEAKKQMRLKYLDFMKQSKNMEEVLQVQSNIDNIQESIEATAGRVSYLNHQSAMSTIRLSFYQPFEEYKPADEKPSFIKRISNAFKTGAQWMGDLLVGFMSIWPLLLIVASVIFLYKKIFIHKKAAA